MILTENQLQQRACAEKYFRRKISFTRYLHTKQIAWLLISNWNYFDWSHNEWVVLICCCVYNQHFNHYLFSVNETIWSTRKQQCLDGLVPLLLRLLKNHSPHTTTRSCMLNIIFGNDANQYRLTVIHCSVSNQLLNQMVFNNSYLWDIITSPQHLPLHSSRYWNIFVC